MSGPSAKATLDIKMLAMSIPPPLPHLLSRHDPPPSPSMFPVKNAQLLDPLSPPKKPKLSLKTSDLATTFHGSLGRSAGISTDATATPTTLNTFNNTFDLTYRPSPVSTLPSPKSHSQRRPSAHTLSPVTRTSDQPYILNLPFGVRPILKNSPLPRDIRRPSISASPRVAGRRVFFPAAKKVTFRAHLEDEIVTKQYVMRHADLTSSEDESTPSETDEQSSTSNDDEEDDENAPTIRVDESVRYRKKRKSAAVSPSRASEVGRGREDGSRSTSARRSRQKRRWQWTIESKDFKGARSESEGVCEESKSSVQERQAVSPTREAQGSETTAQAPKFEKAENPS